MSIWPSIILIVFISWGSLNALMRYGELKKADRHDWIDMLLVPAILVSLLWWGGFWEPLLRIAHG